MLFRKKKEPTAVKIARTAGRVAGTAVRTARKAADVATAAGRASRRTADQVAGAVSRTRKAARRALARRKVKKTLEHARHSLKTVGKAAAVAGLTAAVAATASELVKRRNA